MFVSDEWCAREADVAIDGSVLTEATIRKMEEEAERVRKMGSGGSDSSSRMRGRSRRRRDARDERGGGQMSGVQVDTVLSRLFGHRAPVKSEAEQVKAATKTKRKKRRAARVAKRKVAAAKSAAGGLDETYDSDATWSSSHSAKH